MSESRPASGAAPSSTGAAWRLDWPALAAAAVLAIGALAIYRQSFAVPLLFDDRPSLADNPTIRHLWPLGPLLFPPLSAGVGGRPLLNFTYALNYASGGVSVFGYHVVNLLIHVLASWTLFACLRRTLRRPVLAARFAAVADPLAFLISALWAWHPVQTESVTYLSQRAEALMGLCYLLTLYCFLRYVEASRPAEATPDLPASSGPVRRRVIGPIGWAGLSMLACLAGVATKEVIVTAPVMIFLYDRTFVSGTFSEAWRRHRAVLLGLAATWVPLALFMIGLHHRGVGFGEGGVTWWIYGLTECRSLVKYLGLSFWPHPLIFDYGGYLATGPHDVWPFILTLALLLAASLLAVRRWPAAGFAACWFFLILAPASSIIPVAGQTMAENRLYLSLAGAMAFGALALFAFLGRWALPVLAVLALAAGVGAFRRNQDYRTEVAIWTDTVAKNPANPRSHCNLGEALLRTPGRLPDAIVQFQTAVRLKPDYVEAIDDLGDAWLDSPGKLNDAIAEFHKALELRPTLVEAHFNLANALQKSPGGQEAAIAEFQESLRLNPNFLPGHFNLGNLWQSLPGHLPDAVEQYQETLRLDPDFVQAHLNLGNVFSRLPGKADAALGQYQEAVRLQPNGADPHYNLGNFWLGRRGHLADAATEYQAAVRLRPEFAEAHNNLGNAWSITPGRQTDAIAEYEEALRLNPNYADAHFDLAVVLLKIPAQRAAARTHLEAVLRLQPENTRARQLLAGLGTH